MFGFLVWSDCVFLGKNGEELGRRTDYKSVLAGINMEALQNDYRYRVALMRDLFKQSRVENYLKISEQESPDRPCGKYIGFINHEYGKQFDPSTGRAAHYTNEMRETRYKKQIEERRSKEESIRRAEAEVARLKSELNDLDR